MNCLSNGGGVCVTEGAERAPVHSSQRLPSRKCHKCLVVYGLNEHNFSADGRGGLRYTCRPCISRDDAARNSLRRGAGLRKCRECSEVRAVAEFDSLLRGGKVQRREVCRDCYGKPPNVVEESEVLLHQGLQRHYRWAVSLQILLGRRGMTQADLLALPLADRRAFERRWFDLMRQMADDEGELVVVADPLLTHRTGPYAQRAA